MRSLLCCVISFLLSCGGAAEMAAPVAVVEPDRDGDGIPEVLDIEAPVLVDVEPRVITHTMEGGETPVAVMAGTEEPLLLAFRDDTDADGGGGGGGGPTEAAAPPEPPTPPVADDDEHDHDLLEQLQEADTPKEQVEVQQQVVEQQIEQAADLNDELADIIEELRRKKGLPDKKPYVAPSEIHAQEQLQQVQREPRHPLVPRQEQDTDQEQQASAAEGDEEMEAAAPEEQPQEQEQQKD